jgi:hypothetical protein
MITTNREASAAVASKSPFCTSHGTLFGAWMGETGAYVVYSYSLTWPLVVYDLEADTWFVNTDKYSRTTSAHLTHVRRGVTGKVQEVCRDVALYIANYGYVGYIRHRMENTHA